MSSICTELAANLSTSYLSPAAYDGVSPLADFLTATGVLLTMCVFDNCTTDKISRDDSNAHLSGSWIQASTTGPRVFPVDLFGMGEQTGIGMVLDPLKVDVNCIYPLDGISDNRGDFGCGKVDWKFPWWQTQAFKLEIYWRKWRQFPHTQWKDIPCSKLLDFGKKGGMGSMIVGMVDHEGTTWKTMYYFLQQFLAALIGHTVCYDDTVPDFSNDKQMLTYFGDDSWLPSQWNESAHITQQVIQQHPTSQGIWNEVVMTQVDVQDYSKIVQALFYVDEPHNDTFKNLAYAEAKRLGVEHVLEFDPQLAEQSLFRCPSSPPLFDMVLNTHAQESTDTS